LIVRELSDVIGSWRHAKGEGWESRRIVLADDQMGCSLHDTLVKEGAELHLEYKNHLETNYCIEGEGEVVDVATGATQKKSAKQGFAQQKNQIII
jgi:L-ectoine synthase